MKKIKLSKEAVTNLVNECLAKPNEEFPFNMLIRDPKNPSKVIKSEISSTSLQENKEYLKYLLGQLAVFHTDNKTLIYEQLAFLQSGENWTQNDPLVLNQLSTMAFATGLIGPFKKTQIKGKEVVFACIAPFNERVQPVIHEETEKETPGQEPGDD